jgi:hypothetical protein
MTRLPGLTEREVREVKRALVRGSHPTAIARILGRSAETIRRIMRGETWNHVQVEGEEGLRPALRYEDLAGLGRRPEGLPVVVEGLGEGRVKEIEDLLGLEGGEGGEDPVKVAARKLLGLEV